MNSKELAILLEVEGINNPDVLAAIAKVPRHRFISDDLKTAAYSDEALPIGFGQTISQPFVVARMTEMLLAEEPIHKVLEIGTGSGYQAAILAELVDEVYTIERIKSLYEQATERFEALNYKNIHTLYGDGFLGWPEHGPYDGILITAATPEVPPDLIDQLADKGRMIIPLGGECYTQELCIIMRHGDHIEAERYDPVVFVPMLHGKSEE